MIFSIGLALLLVGYVARILSIPVDPIQLAMLAHGLMPRRILCLAAGTGLIYIGSACLLWSIGALAWSYLP